MVFREKPKLMKTYSVDLMAAFQRFAVFVLSEIGFRTCQRIPQTLHFVERLSGFHSFTCETLAHLRRLLDLPYFQHVLGTFAVHVTVGRVHVLRRVHEFRGLRRVTRFFVDLRFECVKVEESWCVVNGFVDVLKGKVVLFVADKVLSEEVTDPNKCGR